LSQKNHESDDFVRQAATRSGGGPLEFLTFLRETRKWWLMPVVLAVLVMGVLVLLGSTGAAPFIYTLF
jgi:hypothetical protein